MDAASSVHDLLDQAVELLSRVNACDPSELVDAETTEVALLAARAARLAEAAQVRATGRLDRSKEWAADGARSLPVWLGWKAGTPVGRARAVVRCARQLRSMPVAEEALAAGRIGLEHVRLLAHAQHTSPEAFEADEARLVTAGERQLYTAFERVIRYWVQVHAPDRAEADAAEQHDQRRVHASRSFEGTIVVDAMLDPVTGEIWLRELERLEQLEFDADWAEARSCLGDYASAADLRRTPRQRRADALRVMTERSAAKLPGATEARPLIHVVAGTETLKNVCELSNGTVITRASSSPSSDGPTWPGSSSTGPPASST